MAKRPVAVWVSTSLSTRGGIATYVRNMRNTDLWRDWNVVHIATHRNGSVSIRLIAFAVGYGRFLCHSLVKRPNIVHIHMSSYGSFARKYLVMWTAKAFGLPVVLHIHGSQFNEFACSTPHGRSVRSSGPPLSMRMQ